MTIESLDRTFDSYMDLYMTESVSDIPKDIGIFMKRCVMLLDNYVRGIRDVLSEKYKQYQLNHYLNTMERFREYFNDHPIWHKYTKAMVAKDPNYMEDLIFSLARLMKEEASYPEMDRYVKMYLKEVNAPGSSIIEVSYDDLCKYVNTLMKGSEVKIHKILTCMKNFSAMWDYTNREKFSQTMIYGLFKMARSACKEIAIVSLYNLTSFKIYSCEMVTKVISEEEMKSIKNYEKMNNKQRIELEKKSKVVKEYHFGDITITVHELPIKSACAYNRMGKDIYVDQMFCEYPPDVQKAIIYHEIGHTMNGHFGTLFAKNDTIDARRMAHQIKKFKQLLFYSRFGDAIGDDELIYIMVENEADRFASQMVGKKTLDASIKIRMDRKLYSDIPKDINNITERERLLIAYNQERNRFRSALG